MIETIRFKDRVSLVLDKNRFEDDEFYVFLYGSYKTVAVVTIDEKMFFVGKAFLEMAKYPWYDKNRNKHFQLITLYHSGGQLLLIPSAKDWLSKHIKVIDLTPAPK